MQDQMHVRTQLGRNKICKQILKSLLKELSILLLRNSQVQKSS